MRLAGLIEAKRTLSIDTQVTAILPNRPRLRGLSSPFLAQASNGSLYWVKMLSNSQNPRIPIVEQIVAGCGRFLDAPVCSTALLEIPDHFDGLRLQSGVDVRSGVAHGSLNVENNLAERGSYPRHREKDDNRRRHAGYFALFDWCWGADPQWIYDLADQHRTYSFDHGHFLGGGAPKPFQWTEEGFSTYTNSDTEFWSSPRGLNEEEIDRLANRVVGVTPGDIVEILSAIPPEWPVSNSELEAVGLFLLQRAPTVAERIRKLAA